MTAIDNTGAVKKSIAAAVISLTVMLTAFPVEAADGNTVLKEENVYASLNNDGSLRNSYVVNEFDLDEPGLIEDYGEYDEVRNLTTGGTLAVNNGKISANAPGGRFYYQGNSDSMELPWLISISYSLDGKEADARELSGANGSLGIKISIRHNPKVKAFFADHYAVQTTVTLPSELCRIIRAEGAAAANAGADKVLTFTMLPGDTAEYLVSAEVRDFRMDAVKFSAIPFTMDISAPDTGILTDKLSQMTEGIEQLDAGAQSLEAGAGELTKGAGELKNGMKGMMNGISGLTGGLGILTAQNAGLTAGADELLKGLDTVSESLPESMAQLKGALSDLAVSFVQFSKGLEAYTDGVAEINKNSIMLNNSFVGLSKGYDSINTGISELYKGSRQLADGTEEFRKGISGIDGEVDAAIDNLLESYTGGNFEPVSFISEQNENVKSVQFIMQTQGIEEKRQDITVQKEEKKQTFWERLLALFGL